MEKLKFSLNPGLGGVLCEAVVNGEVAMAVGDNAGQAFESWRRSALDIVSRGIAMERLRALVDIDGVNIEEAQHQIREQRKERERAEKAANAKG